MIDDAIAEFSLNDGGILIVRIADGEVTVMVMRATGPFSAEVLAPTSSVVEQAQAAEMRVAHGLTLFRPATAHERMQVLLALHHARSTLCPEHAGQEGPPPQG